MGNKPSKQTAQSETAQESAQQPQQAQHAESASDSPLPPQPSSGVASSAASSSGEHEDGNNAQRFTAWSKQKKAQLDAKCLTCAMSITNSTQLPVNLALSQLGPLMYAVVQPGEVFVRRVPPIWFRVRTTAWTGQSSQFNAWSTTWPILAVLGPASAITSLLLIPFFAESAAIASFASATAAAASGAASALTKTTAGAAAAAAQLAALPGGQKTKTKLTEAAQSLFDKGIEKAGEQGGRKIATYVWSENQSRQDARRRRREKREKIGEVDVTGHELDKVITCSTDNAETNKALKRLFKKLSFFDKSFQPKENPVCNLVGGPEIEEKGGRHFMVFYHFRLERIVEINVVPLSTEEAPPLEDEQQLVDDARVIDNLDDARAISKQLPKDALADPNAQPEPVPALEGTAQKT